MNTTFDGGPVQADHLQSRGLCSHLISATGAPVIIVDVPTPCATTNNSRYVTGGSSSTAPSEVAGNPQSADLEAF